MGNKEQQREFERVAHDLGRDENEGRSNATLKRIAPKPKDDNAKTEK